MGDYFTAGEQGELADGTMTQVSIHGHRLLLARVGGRYYAADSRCPHMGGNLAHGRLDGTVVTCPRHGSRFDLDDGRVLRWLQSPRPLSAVGRVLKPPRPLKTYSVKLEDGKIMVEI